MTLNLGWVVADTAAAHPAQDLWERIEAWNRWRHASCVEWNGGHEWLVELAEDDDGPYVGVYCEHCFCSQGDGWPDWIAEAVSLEFDDVQVHDGTHTADQNLFVPVDVDVTWHHHHTANGDDWECLVEFTQRGPVVDMDGDPYHPAPRIHTIVPIWDADPEHMEEA